MTNEQALSRSLTAMVEHILCENGVDVTVIDDTPDPYTPDSIFPKQLGIFS